MVPMPTSGALISYPDDASDGLSNKYSAAVFLAGRIFFVPMNSLHVLTLVVPSEPPIVQRVMLPSDIYIDWPGQPSLFKGGVAARGALFLVPFDADVVLKLDVTSDAWTVAVELRPNPRYVSFEGAKFAAGVLVGAAIFFIPYKARHVGRLDLDGGQFDLITLPGNIAGPRMFDSAVADSAGRIYMIPWGVQYITVFTPGIAAGTGTFTQVGSPKANPQYHSCLYTQGAVYAISRTFITKLVYDGIQEVMQDIPIPMSIIDTYGAVLIEDGILILPWLIGYGRRDLGHRIDPGTEAIQFVISTGELKRTHQPFENLVGMTRFVYGGVAVNGRVYIVPSNKNSIVVLS